MPDLSTHVKRRLAAWQAETGQALWSDSEMLTIAVSGGPDSLVLLHLFVKQSLHPREKIVVAHLDHQLRPESAADARMVAALCASWDVRCVTGVIDVRALANEHGLSLEEAARKIRYRFLGQVAVDAQSAHVLVGHTRDDQAETVLMNLLRGSGTRGLQGIRPIRRFPAQPGIKLVRPLLSVSRAQIVDYCRRHDLHPIEDPSNADIDFFRNRIRHELMPLLETYNPQIQERLHTLGHVVRADIDFLSLQTLAALRAILRGENENGVRLDLHLWQQLPLSLRRRTLRELVRRVQPSARDINFATLEQARLVAEQGTVGAQSSLPGDLVLQIDYDAIQLFRAGSPPKARDEGPQLTASESQSLPIPGEVPLSGRWLLEAHLLSDPEDVTLDDNPWAEYIDAANAGSLHIRSRRPGDTIQPLGLQGHSAKVSDIMVNRRIPRELRDQWPIVSNESHIVWVVGLALDRRVKIHEETRGVIQLRCQQRAM